MQINSQGFLTTEEQISTSRRDACWELAVIQEGIYSYFGIL
jgi:hypothetical protein